MKMTKFNLNKTYKNAKVRTDVLELAKTKVSDDMTVADAREIERAGKLFMNSLKKTVTRWLLEVHNVDVEKESYHWTDFNLNVVRGKLDTAMFEITSMDGESGRAISSKRISAKKLMNLYSKN